VRWCAVLFISVALNSRGAGAQSDSPKADITGGPDTTGQSYTWVVANQYDSPIVRVEIPHFRGGLFNGPEGWSADCTNLVGVGVDNEPGLCTGRADSPRYRVAKPNTATFHLQLSARGAKQGVGDVVVHFADGSNVTVGRVMLPVRESLVEKFSSVLGLAIVGALVITIGGRRRRKAHKAAAS